VSVQEPLAAPSDSQVWIDALYDPALSGFLAAAQSRLLATAARDAPFLAEQLTEWITRKLAPEGRPEDYYRKARAYPTLLFPWYVARALGGDGEADAAFHADLVYSSINGYYFIRLLDNVMDGEADMETALLPAAGVLHWEFQAAYRPYFAADHPFWSFAGGAWAAAADAAVHDAVLEDIGEAEFLAICGHKSGAAKIPIAAVCHRYGRADLIPPWSRFLDRFGAWHQMVNDLFGWEKDSRLGHQTFVLCEADRRRRPGELVADWIAREGFEWGVEILTRWISELQAEAHGLECPPAVAYLKKREEWLAVQARNGREGLRALAQLLAAVRVHQRTGA